jgi:hypothetical protein
MFLLGDEGMFILPEEVIEVHVFAKLVALCGG